MAREKKLCPKCELEVPARIRICPFCEYDFYSNKTERIEKRKVGKGRKECPKCKSIVGSRSLKCKCGYEFFSKNKKEIDKTIEEKEIDPRTEELMNELAEKIMTGATYFTPDEHAKGIIRMGRNRAILVLKRAIKYDSWKHVNWELVAKKLKMEI